MHTLEYIDNKSNTKKTKSELAEEKRRKTTVAVATRAATAAVI